MPTEKVLSSFTDANIKYYYNKILLHCMNFEVIY